MSVNSNVPQDAKFSNLVITGNLISTKKISAPLVETTKLTLDELGENSIIITENIIDETTLVTSRGVTGTGTLDDPVRYSYIPVVFIGFLYDSAQEYFGSKVYIARSKTSIDTNTYKFLAFSNFSGIILKISYNNGFVPISLSGSSFTMEITDTNGVTIPGSSTTGIVQPKNVIIYDSCNVFYTFENTLVAGTEFVIKLFGTPKNPFGNYFFSIFGIFPNSA